jgi:hypothetical protein
LDISAFRSVIITRIGSAISVVWHFTRPIQPPTPNSEVEVYVNIYPQASDLVNISHSFGLGIQYLRARGDANRWVASTTGPSGMHRASSVHVGRTSLSALYPRASLKGIPTHFSWTAESAVYNIPSEGTTNTNPQVALEGCPTPSGGYGQGVMAESDVNWEAQDLLPFPRSAP